MSGKPSPEGVSKAIQLLGELDKLEAEVIDLRFKTARLKEAEREWGTAASALQKLMAEMDCESTGNFGHGSRFAWMLGEMRRQLLAANAVPETA